MRVMAKARLILFVSVFCLFISAGGGERANSGKTPFNWSLGLLHVQSGEMLEFDSTVQSATGERFRIVISPETACFAYVIYESAASGAELDVIYSGPIKHDETWYSNILELLLPGGLEQFYIVVSQDEQKSLSQKITELRQNPLTAQKNALKNEIARLQGEVSKTAEAPPVPSTLGGAARGKPGKNRGVEFSGLHTYVKTIAIEH